MKADRKKKLQFRSPLTWKKKPFLRFADCFERKHRVFSISSLSCADMMESRLLSGNFSQTASGIVVAAARKMLAKVLGINFMVHFIAFIDAQIF